MSNQRFHPIHPGIVHFPIVLWTVVTLLDAGNYILNSVDIWYCSYYSLIAGTVMACIAMMSGVLELSRIESDKAWKRLELHVTNALICLFFYGASLTIKVNNHASTEMINAELLLEMGGFLMLTFTGYHGAALIYKHQIGVEKQQED